MLLPKVVEIIHIFNSTELRLLNLSNKRLFLYCSKKKKNPVITLSHKEWRVILEIIGKFQVLRTITLTLELWLKLVKGWMCRNGATFLRGSSKFSWMGKKPKASLLRRAGASSFPSRGDGGQEGSKQEQPRESSEKFYNYVSPSHECFKYFRLFASYFLEILLKL